MQTQKTDAKIVSNDRSKSFYVYAGQTEPGIFGYYQITTLESNNGESIAGMNCRRYKKPLFKNRTIGAIFPIESEADLVYFNINATPSAYWQNRDDVAGWQITNRSSELVEKKKKDAKKNEFESVLDPIRNAYQTASYQQRSLIIAEVIRIITKPI